DLGCLSFADVHTGAVRDHRVALVRPHRHLNYSGRGYSHLVDASDPGREAGTSMTFIVVGVDGGGSKTRVIVADEHGTHLGEVVGPGRAGRPGQAGGSAGGL